MAQISSFYLGNKLRWVFAAIILLSLVHFTVYQGHGFQHIQPTVWKGKDSSKASAGPFTTPIPNIAHYVWVRRESNAELSFEFKHWISAYSAYLYFKPDAIYIHLDAPNETIERARSSGNIWTQKLMSIPGLVFRHVDVPTHANNGIELAGVEHRSDFIRPSIMLEYGGIYMDFDVLPIRDVKPLREANFNNVLGHELYEGINNGVWLSKPGTTLMKLFNEEQHKVYDREWTTHSVILLTRIANSVVHAGNEVLIMERKAFNPTSWEQKDFVMLFQPHPETPPPPLTDAQATATYPPNTDIRILWQTNRDAKREEWEVDFSMSYVIHAISPSHHGGAVPNFTDVSLGYILARESNYARAAFPAIWHAIRNGVIKKDETG